MSQVEREPNDWYQEEPQDVEALLTVEDLTGTVRDPAAGEATIPRVLRSRGIDAFGTDLIERNHGGLCTRTGVDFTLMLPAEERDSVDHVVSNPPFKLAEEFARNGLLVARRKVALLLPLTFLESTGRGDLFDNNPLARVWVFRRRLNMPPAGQSITRGGGKKAFAWFVWDRGYRGPMGEILPWQGGWLP